MASFEEAIPFVLKHEGGYVNDPADPGGETNFGISKRSFPNEDIKNLTPERASYLYKVCWWDKYHYSNFTAQTVGGKVFDMAVNMGAARAHKLLQTVLNVTVDGMLGPGTFAAANAAEPAALVDGLRGEAKNFYLSLVARRPSMSKFLKGWLNRAAF